MARKALSAQVIDEVDRARGLLAPVQGIVDPMTSHMVGAVLESLHRIESMCISARQRDVNAALSDTPLGLAFAGDALAQAQTPKRSTTHKTPRTRKEAK